MTNICDKICKAKPIKIKTKNFNDFWSFIFNESDNNFKDEFMASSMLLLCILRIYREGISLGGLIFKLYKPQNPIKSQINPIIFRIKIIDFIFHF